MISTEEEDKWLRDLMISSSAHLTEEQMREIESEAPWIKLTDEGFECSRGMVELMRYTFGFTYE